MLGITSCLDRFLKHNLVHGFFDTFFPITQAQSHYALYTLLDETEMTQNNSGFFFFVFPKTFSYSPGRLNLRIDMNQVTNLKSLDSTWKK